MNDNNLPAGAAQINHQQELELDWGHVLDCGALGPSRDEPELFYQRPQERVERGK